MASFSSKRGLLVTVLSTPSAPKKSVVGGDFIFMYRHTLAFHQRRKIRGEGEREREREDRVERERGREEERGEGYTKGSSNTRTSSSGNDSRHHGVTSWA